MSGRLHASGAGGEVVGIGFAGDLEDGDTYFFGTSGRWVNHSASAQDCITALALALPDLALSATSWKKSNISRVDLSALAATAPDHGVVEHIDQWLDVETTDHGAEQLGGLFAGDERTACYAAGEHGKKLGFDLGGIVHAGWYALGDQVDEESFRARI